MQHFLKKYPSTFFILFATTILFACQKRENQSKTDALTINVENPIEASSYKLGDTVWIRANARYTDELHGYTISISNALSNRVYFSVDEHLHKQQMNINTYWVNTVPGDSNIIFKFTVIADHDGTQKTKEINLKTQNPTL